MTVEQALQILSGTIDAPTTEAELAAVLCIAQNPVPREEWREDNGIVLWWEDPAGGAIEPPYVGTPLDDDFPEWVTHWTPIIIPDFDN